MSLAVAIQMDPIEPIDIDADSSFVLALEAQRRGHGLYHYLPKNLFLKNGRIYAKARPLKVRREKGNHFTLGEPQTLDLATMDVVLLRQDPPFDMAYITTTHLLEHVHPKTLVVNDPVHVRNAPEKLFITHFEGVLPPTLITSDKAEIEAFRAVQRYLPEVRKGDKRIILVDGVAKGAVLRVPQKGEARANLHAGAQAVKTTLTKRERELCEKIGPALKSRGLIFVGIDVIGDYLTEINVTSPTGLQQIDRFDGVSLEADIWDAIEARRSASGAARPS
jgi:glutathione synthase